MVGGKPLTVPLPSQVPRLTNKWTVAATFNERDTEVFPFEPAEYYGLNFF
jgi:hypothetical protein